MLSSGGGGGGRPAETAAAGSAAAAAAAAAAGDRRPAETSAAGAAAADDRRRRRERQRQRRHLFLDELRLAHVLDDRPDNPVRVLVQHRVALLEHLEGTQGKAVFCYKGREERRCFVRRKAVF